MAWKGENSEGVAAMSSADIKWAQWLRVARNFQLRVGLKDRSRETFDGFTREVSMSHTAPTFRRSFFQIGSR
jgi:structure-specific recognition protein 1